MQVKIKWSVEEKRTNQTFTAMENKSVEKEAGKKANREQERKKSPCFNEEK